MRPWYVVLISDANDAKMVLDAAKSLRKQNVSVAKDYPDEIRRARETLWPKLKAARQQGKEAYIGFPAKLVVENHVEEDVYPDWWDVLHPKYPRDDRRGQVSRNNNE